MIISKTKEAIEEILNFFESPKLVYDYKIDAGPDEELYFFQR